MAGIIYIIFLKRTGAFLTRSISIKRGMHVTFLVSLTCRIFIPSSILLFFFVLLPSFSAAAQKAGRLFEPDILADKSYTEIFTLTAMYDDHTFVQVQMTFTNLGVENRNAACKALVLTPAQKPWKVNEQFNEKQWKYAEKPGPTLSIGANTLKRLQDRIEFSAILGKGTISVSLFGSPATVKPPNTDFPKNASGKFYDFEIIVPWSRVTTTLSLPGLSQKTLQGFGILERSRSVGTSRVFSRGWVTFRGYQGDAFFLANFRLPPQVNSPAAGWILKNGEQKPLAMTGLQISREFSIVDGKEKEVRVISPLDNSFRISGGDLLYRYSFVDELGAFTGYLVKMVIGKPVTSYYDANVQLPGGTPVLHGVLEVMTIE
jgi:hypothetical protein